MNQNVVILLAEDNLGHAKLTKKNLKRAGITNTIYHFQNGAELLDYLKGEIEKELHFDSGQRYIIIMDLKMPKLDGLETLKYLKKNDDFAIIPVIMFSTSDDPKEIYHCYKQGCNGYVVKPVISSDFTSFITNLVSYFSIIQIPAVKKTIGISSLC